MVLRSTLSSPIIRILFAIVSGGQPLYLVCYKSVKMIDVFQLRIIKNGLKLKKKQWWPKILKHSFYINNFLTIFMKVFCRVLKKFSTF